MPGLVLADPAMAGDIRKPGAMAVAIAGSLVTAAAPADAASATSGGFAVTRAIVAGRVTSVAYTP
jgi:hypothetical protein